jgi:periplasmic protein TonB
MLSDILTTESPALSKVPRSSRRRSVILSACTHLLMLAFLLHAKPVRVAPLQLAGDEHGSRLVLAYLPGHAPPPSGEPLPRKTQKTVPLPQVQSPLPAPAVEKQQASSPNSVASPSAAPDSTAGPDALGSGDISIAVLKISPRPRPDLSVLPKGSGGDVVLDALIGPEGNIEKLTLVKGLGHGIDEVVIATVQAWTFLPATKDGKPVASEQELHFHYERG